MNKQGKLNGAPTCPHCNKLLDGYTATDGNKDAPKERDFSVCYYCNTLLVFKKAPHCYSGALWLCMANMNDYLHIADHGFTIEKIGARIVVTGREKIRAH